MCSPKNKLSIKQDLFELFINPFSCKIQMFKVTLMVSYLSQKNWKSSAIFHRRTMAMAAMDMVFIGGFREWAFIWKNVRRGSPLYFSRKPPLLLGPDAQS